MKLATASSGRSLMDYVERRPAASKWLWLALGGSVAVHVAAGFWLHSQKFQIADLPAPDAAPPVTVTMERPKPLEPEPVVQPDAPPPAPNTRLHQTPLPTQPTEVLNVAPSDATDQPAGPINLTTTVETPADVTGVVTRDPAPVRDPVIRNPSWISRPSEEHLMRAYPTRALERGVIGAVQLSCGVRANGAMTACSVVSETPGGHGFGRAAMGLTRHFRISPQTVDGRAVEGSRVAITLQFNVTD